MENFLQAAMVIGLIFAAILFACFWLWLFIVSVRMGEGVEKVVWILVFLSLPMLAPFIFIIYAKYWHKSRTTY
jgi:hypothetical protein